jgi:hypothetical protein
MSYRLPALLVLFLCLGGPSTAQVAVLIPLGSQFRYTKGPAEPSSPSSAWRTLGFNDSTWALGRTPFYYDTGSDYTGNTLLNDMRNQYTTVFLRRTFNVSDPAAFGQITLRGLVDDGFAAWINGTLLTSFNVRDDNYAASNTAASNAPEPLQWVQQTFPNPATWLQPGPNVLAVQGFNYSLSSSDFFLELELGATEPDTTPPVITSVDPPPGLASQLNRITVTFSEPVTGLGFSDLRVNAQPAIGLSGSGAVYHFDFVQPPYGPVVVDWDPGSFITDLALPPNLFDTAAPNATWSYDFRDLDPPTVLILTPAPGVTVRSFTQLSVRFSESVQGVTPGALTVNGLPCLGVVGEDAGPYVFQLPAVDPGLIQLAWSTSDIVDLATPPNSFAGGSWTITYDPAYEPPFVRVNEILAYYSGATGLRDEDDELQDWIELFNPGTQTVHLAGWSLTDTPSRPDQWIFPDISLGPGQYRVIFASGKDRRPTSPNARLHTNFKLSIAGEAVGLYDSSYPRTLVSGFMPEYPPQRSDHSYGWDPQDHLRYFATPTPGAANGTSTILGLAPPVDSNISRGLFDRPITLILQSALPDAQIRYTRDGREPSSTTGFPYTAPIHIDQTSIIRAAAFKAGYLPSEVTTHTYIFPNQVVHQPILPPGVPSVWIDTQNRSWTADYEMDPEITQDPQYRDQMLAALTALPVLSIVTDPANLFDNSTGIYPKSQNRGAAWERPASAELILPNGEPGFQIDCGIQCQGNSVRDPVKTPKHAFRLLFKGDYGAGKLHYRMFPGSPVEEFNTLVLRADFNTSWLHWDGTQRARAQRTRDAFMKDSLRDMGALSSHNRYVHLYLNGLYWGIYDPAERPDASFAASYLGGQREDYDVVNEGALVEGTMTAYNAMLALTNLADPAQYQQIHNYLDVTQYIDYILSHFYVGHQDWGRNKNWYTMRRREPGAGFMYVSWDGESIFWDANANRVSNTDTASDLHTRLVQNPEYRLRFADHVRRHCFGNGALTPTAVRQRWLNRAQELEVAVIAESARWGDYRRDVHQYSGGPYELYTRNQHWFTEQNRLLNNLFPNRTTTLLTQLRNAGLYPTTAAPEFSLPEGRVPRHSLLTITTPAGTTYFTTNDTDPRVAFSGDIHAQARPYSTPITLDTTTRIRARTLHQNVWSAITEALYLVDAPAPLLRFTEIMYNPVEGDPYEFLELQNCSPTSVDISGGYLDGVRYVFPPGSTLAPGQIVVLAAATSPGAFQNRYPTVSVYGWFDGRLDNAGERLALYNAQHVQLTAVTYDDENGWPLQADGWGASLEVVDPLANPNDPANWRASTTAGGTPGYLSPPPPAPTVRINELLSAAPHPDHPDLTDFIELHNPTPSPVSLDGWSLSDRTDPRHFVFPTSTTIPANGYLVLWSAPSGTAPGLYGGFGLSRSGETVSLFNSAGTRIDAITLGRQEPEWSLGRAGPDLSWTICQPTPGTANTPQATAPLSQLALNEWLAHPIPTQPQWIEFHNPHTTLPILLDGPWITSNGRATQVLEKSVVRPSGFIVLLTDSLPGPGHLDLQLPTTTATLTLLDAAGNETDRVLSSPQLDGVSQGRLPDATGPVVAFPASQSPGAPNYLPAYNGPLLNEFMAWNQGAVPHPTSQNVDWVELHNPNTQPFDLGGMGLSDSTSAANRWFFPPNTSLGPNQYLVVWFDPTRPSSAPGQTPFSISRGLGRRNGAIFLFNPQGQVVDSVEYGPQIRNLSVGRHQGQWRLLSSPTPDLANSTPATLGNPAALRINEWMAAPTQGPDWIELFHTGSLPVELTQLSLTDNPSLWGPTPFRFLPLSFIGPQGFVLVHCDGLTGPVDAPFKLSSTGEAIVLRDPTGIVIDEMFFGPQSTGQSQGRLPDGASFVTSFPLTPTPDAANYLPLDTIAVNEVLTHTDPPLEDAIELLNLSSSSVNLSGWYLSDDPASLRNTSSHRAPASDPAPSGSFTKTTSLTPGTSSPSASTPSTASTSFFRKPIPPATSPAVDISSSSAPLSTASRSAVTRPAPASISSRSTAAPSAMTSLPPRNSSAPAPACQTPSPPSPPSSSPKSITIPPPPHPPSMKPRSNTSSSTTAPHKPPPSSTLTSPPTPGNSAAVSSSPSPQTSHSAPINTCSSSASTPSPPRIHSPPSAPIIKSPSRHPSSVRGRAGSATAVTPLNSSPQTAPSPRPTPTPATSPMSALSLSLTTISHPGPLKPTAPAPRSNDDRPMLTLTNP